MRKPLVAATLFLALLAAHSVSSNVDSDITFDDDGTVSRHPRHAPWAGPLPHPESSKVDHHQEEQVEDLGLLARLKRDLWDSLNFWESLRRSTTTSTTTTTTEPPSTDPQEPLAAAVKHPEDSDLSLNQISPSPTVSASELGLSTRTLDRETRSTDEDESGPGVTVAGNGGGRRDAADEDDEDLQENSGDVPATVTSGEPPAVDSTTETTLPPRRTRSVYRITMEVHEFYKESLSQRNSEDFKKFAESFTAAVDSLFLNFPGRQNSRVISVQPDKDQFYSKVTIDLGSIEYSNSNEIKNHIWQSIVKGRIGEYAVKDSDFTFRDFTETGSPSQPLSCPAGEIPCADNSRCVPSDARCDGVVHCPDASDEHGCEDIRHKVTESEVTPGAVEGHTGGVDPSECRGDIIERCRNGAFFCGYMRCDGNFDCHDGTDEEGCPGKEPPVATTTTTTTTTEEPYVCGQGEFVCDLRRCIPRTAVCDGHRDCSDGTDEHNCHHVTERPRECASSDFRCNDGSCVPYLSRCDLVPDCPEGEDEHHCYEPPSCSEGEFTCTDNRCIDEGRVCDGVPDCTDGLDEKGCHACHVGYWQCDDGTCIEESKKCDGKRDCPRDNSDETNNCPPRSQCEHNQLRCGDGNTCYYRNQTCNRVKDCPDGRDEENCNYCESDQFRCYDGTCLKGSQKCDGRRDCAESEDELYCPGDGQRCMPGEFECRNGICITETYRCDQIKDCTDNSDEENCSEVCGPGDVICGDGTCVRESKKCDNIQDCSDGADERDCPQECTSYEFKCASGECIKAHRRCDRHSDCRDGSDEIACPRECTSYEFKCASGECIEGWRRCDRRSDCNDGSDEFACFGPPETTTTTTTHRPPPQHCLSWEFRCRSGECIPADAQCDERVDCRDGSDEHNCINNPELILKTYPQQQTIKESREVVFQCRDEGLGHIPVRWVREGNQLMPPGTRDHNGRLEMPNIQLSHSGTYYCEAVGVPSSTRDARVPVYLKVEPFEIPTAETPACGPDQATCYNRECIPKHKVCDGHHDCGDGSDESRCSPWGCEPNEFRCDNRKCVRKSWLCDSDDDCGDGSDERDCERPAIPGSRCHINEFECRSRDQCIPKWFHCDSQNDCQDGSDEIGCFPLKIEQPPPPMVILNQGETFNITCIAVGVPTPIISWRLNWGHIPAKCRTTSVNGIGVLTCPNIQESDQGAYSCEAMDSRFSIIAQPDTHLQVKTDAIPSCPEGTFNDLATDPRECIKCFCFGATYSCKSANLFTYQLQPPLYPFRIVNVRVNPSGGVDLRSGEQSVYQQSVRSLPDRGFEINAQYPVSYGESPGVYPYFPMPENYHGNQLKSYGGFINYRVKFDGPGRDYLDIPDVILTGNNHVLIYKISDNLRRGVDNDVSVQLFTGNWRKVTGQRWTYATREDIMMTLVNLENILIKTQYLSGPGIQSEITGIQMDSAGITNTGQGKAAYVEECQCPAGYTGLSCEECAPGYLRRSTEPQQWLGKCYREEETCAPGTYGDPARGIPCRVCPCPLTSPSNQFGKTCRLDSDSGVTCDCPSGYVGRRCEFCAAGYIGNPLQPGDSCRPSDCDPVGSKSLIPDPQTGQCECKAFTTGPTCNYCKANTFHLSPGNKNGCTSCFCMGVTETCSSSNWYRDEVKSVFTRDDQAFKMITREDNIEVPIRFDASSREIYYDSFEPKVYYWILPQRFLGDKVTAYGGKLTYTLRYVPAPGGQSSRNTAPDVTMISPNGIELSHYSKVQVEPDRPVTITVPILEQYWQRPDGAYTNREHLLMTLADLSDIMIKATYTTNTRQAALVSVVLDTATERNTGLARAVEVEQCQCPEGYIGLSCEDCVAGYTRVQEGLYLGLCEPCNCTGHSLECDPETGDCINCRGNRAGPNCNECKPGYEERGGRCEPKESDCRCDPRGSLSTECVNDRCRCKTNVIGDRCDDCRPGTFNLLQTNPEGCQECYCSGVTSDCKPSNMYIEQIPSLIIDDNHGFTLTLSDRTEAIRDGFDINPSMNEISYDLANRRRNRYFWSLPSHFTGDKVTSYGGKLTFTQRFQGHSDGTFDKDMDVIITGHGLSLFTSFEEPIRANERKTFTVPLTEEHWRRMDAQSGGVRASRQDLLKVLSDVEAIMVRASLSRDVTRTYLSDVTMDTAVSQRTGVPAKQVEVCRCPPQYKGTSCELCADHYYKDFDQVCKPCPCNNNEESCSPGPNYQVVCLCKHGFSGNYCEYPDDHMTTTTTPPPRPRPTIVVTISDPTIQIVPAGTSVSFHCKAESLVQRPVSLYWSKQGGYLPSRASDDGRGFLRFETTVESDSGVYVCTANDGLSTNSERATLTVGSRDHTRPVVRITPTSVDAREGDSVDIECQATGNPSPSITWRRLHNVTMNPQARTYYGLLRFPAISINDAGVYECTGYNEAGSDTQYIQVSVREHYAPPDVTLEVNPSKFSGLSGETVQLYCRSVSPHSNYRLMWTRDGNRPLPVTATQRDGSLTIVNSSPADSGTYICVATDSSTGSRLAEIDAYVDIQEYRRPPSIIIEPERQRVPQGTRAELRCIVQGESARITWTKGSEQIPSHVEINDNLLVIPSVRTTDRGMYICQASNLGGSSQKAAFIDIERREAPTIEIYPRERQVVNEGSSLMIQCRALSGVPSPRIYWTRGDNSSLPQSVEQPQNGIILFNSVRLSDSGEYVCHAENIAGRVSSVTYVTVHSYPRIQVEPRGRINLIVGERLNLNCRATGEPTPTVSWEMPRSPVRRIPESSDQQAEVEITSVALEDSGTYTCTAINQAGRNAESVYVYVTKEYEHRGDIPGEPGYREPEEAVTVALGHNTNISCRLPPDLYLEQQPRFEWRRVDGSPMSPRIRQTNGFLELFNAESSDSGVYSCSVYNQTGQLVEKRLRLHVAVPPRVTLRPTRQIVKPGESPSIQCDAEGDQPMSISWKAVNRALPETATANDGLLRFSQITFEDAGRYVCIAVNSAGRSEAAAEVIVSEHETSRVVTAVERNMNVYEGNRVTLQCTEQFPTVGDQMEWSRENGRLPPHARANGSNLIFDRVWVQDSGRYVCSTRSASDYIDLNIISANPVTLNIQPSIDVIHVGDSVDLRCVTQGVSGSEITWTKPGGPMPSNVQISNNLLRIPDVTSRHVGVYRCSARGPSGYLEDEFVLNVQGQSPMSDDAEALTTKQASVGQTVLLNCDSMLALPVSYRWTKRNGPLPHNAMEHHDTLTIPDVVLADAGMYICTASNGEVQMDKPIILTVTGAIPFFAQAPLSYIALRPLLNSHINFSIELLIKPDQRDGLILYNSQHRGREGDFFSFGLTDGIPQFRFDVGSGPAIITGDEPVTMGEWHHIRLKRDRKMGEMWVDDRGPYVGQSAGQYQGLDLQDRLYVGSVPDFSNINKLAGFDRGFVGCISKLKVGDEEDISQNKSLEWVGVTTCETCTERGNVCTNNGVCQEAVNERGYVCICPRGFGGHDCSRIGEVCSPGACGEGDCEMVNGRHHCKCHMGKAGARCERDIDISIPKFSNNAYIAYQTPKFSDRMKIEMKINPVDDSDGLILYSGQHNGGQGDYMSLAIRNRRYEFKFDSGQGTVTLESDRYVTPGHWVTLTAAKDSSRAALGVDSDFVHATLSHRDRSGLNLRTPLYLGGYDRVMTLNREVGIDTGFNGCVSQLDVSGMHLDILRSAWNSSNVLDCMSHHNGGSHGSLEGDACSRSPCRHGGACHPSRRYPDKYTCRCPTGYSGQNCEIESDQCETLYPCHNGGSCVPRPGSYKCNCPMGHAGDNCEQSVEIDYDVSLRGDGYIELSDSLLPHTEPDTLETISIDFSTHSPDGLLFWHGQPLKHEGKKESDYLAIAVVDGEVELSYELGSGPGTGRVRTRVDDGKKHKIHVARQGHEATLKVDSEEVKVSSAGFLTQLNTKSNIYIGGTPNNEVMTEGRYEHGFSGCIQRLRIQDSGDIEFGSRALSSVNALPCTSHNNNNGDYDNGNGGGHDTDYDDDNDDNDHYDEDDNNNYDDEDEETHDNNGGGGGTGGQNHVDNHHGGGGSRRGDIFKKK